METDLIFEVLEQLLVIAVLSNKLDKAKKDNKGISDELDLSRILSLKILQKYEKAISKTLLELILSRTKADPKGPAKESAEPNGKDSKVFLKVFSLALKIIDTLFLNLSDEAIEKASPSPDSLLIKRLGSITQTYWPALKLKSSDFIPNTHSKVPSAICSRDFNSQSKSHFLIL